ncbi:MAG: sulfotransferase family 2 domain-containing protein [Bacteroidota bacterium]|nr:sulfotransferase family 2 domain-containing protein [Bacteroidota bacterium]
MIPFLKHFISSPKTHPMLRAFEKKRCIFFHIPKTAGMAVSSAIFGDITWGHRDVSFYVNHFGKERFYSFYKFTVVRNPYDRLYSAYVFLKNGGINQHDTSFSRKYLSKYPTFDDFVRHGLNDKDVNRWVHFLPQHHFIKNKNGNIVVDFIAKKEQLETDFETICRYLNVSVSLQTINQTGNKKDLSLTEDVKSIIKTHYKEDFNLFYPDLF